MDTQITVQEELERSRFSARIASIIRRHSLNLEKISNLFQISQLQVQSIIKNESNLSLPIIKSIDFKAQELDFWMTMRRAKLMECSAIARKYDMPFSDAEKEIADKPTKRVETEACCAYGDEMIGGLQ